MRVPTLSLFAGSGLGLVLLLAPTPSIAQLSCSEGFNGQVIEFTGSAVSHVLPPDATSITVRAIGGGGGSGDAGGVTRVGGSGALIQGSFLVAGGATLQILVGGAGASAPSNGGGSGGGGTYVGVGASLAGSSALVIAGGGGGAGRGTGATGGHGGIPGATVAPSGTAGGQGGTAGGDGGNGDQDPNIVGELGALGGTAGEGGGGTSGCDAGGGAGLNSNGGLGGATTAAIALINGGAGGTGGLEGGFGGGGAGSSCGGGGGGYSGGGAGGDGDFGNPTRGGGGGGGSFNDGTDQQNQAGFNTAGNDGLVELCFDGTVEGESRTTFEVTKEFTDGDNPTEVEVTINCFTGLPIEQSQTVTETQGVEFVVTDFDNGELDCEITEETLSGYTPTYNPDGPGSYDSDGGCNFQDVEGGAENTCHIVNDADPVDVEIEKLWVIEGDGGDAVDTHYKLTLHCDAPIVDGNECGYISSDVSSPEGIENGSYCKKFYGNDSQTFVGQVIPEYPESHCWVDESVYDSAVEIDNDCGSLVVSAGEGDSCVITNTVFFEGIPTLSRYGVAMMALLMLGIGLVAFRRIV